MFKTIQFGICISLLILAALVALFGPLLILPWMFGTVFLLRFLEGGPEVNDA